MRRTYNLNLFLLLTSSFSCFQLRSALGKVGDVASVNSIMDRADVNGDGEISYDEYYRLMNMDKFGDAAVRSSRISYGVKSHTFSC